MTIDGIKKMQELLRNAFGLTFVPFAFVLFARSLKYGRVYARTTDRRGFKSVCVEEKTNIWNAYKDMFEQLSGKTLYYMTAEGFNPLCSIPTFESYRELEMKLMLAGGGNGAC